MLNYLIVSLINCLFTQIVLLIKEHVILFNFFLCNDEFSMNFAHYVEMKMNRRLVPSVRSSPRN